MSSIPVIPLEIDEIIVDFLAEDDEDYSAVKACSLVCRTFLPLCRRQIFASIALNLDSSPTTHQLERLLSKSSVIADYIRKLDYHIVADDLTNSSIQECLKRISRLQSLSLCHYNWYLDWSSNHLRPALLCLLHLPTLTHFQTSGINNFAPSDLIPCVNLKKLDISGNATIVPTNTFPETLPDHSIRLNELIVGRGNAKAIINMFIAQRLDGQPFIDSSSLTKIKLEIDSDNEALQEFFSRCGQLTDVYICFSKPRRTFPSLSKMLWPSREKLTHLNITTFVDGPDIDPLMGIPSEFEDMRNKNIIENIAITVEIQGDADCRRGDDWGRLDEVLTRSGWSALREVSLNIDSLNLHRDDEELEVALLKLPETQFRRLSTSKSVSFKFDVAVRTG